MSECQRKKKFLKKLKKQLWGLEQMAIRVVRADGTEETCTVVTQVDAAFEAAKATLLQQPNRDLYSTILLEVNARLYVIATFSNSMPQLDWWMMYVVHRCSIKNPQGQTPNVVELQNRAIQKDRVILNKKNLTKEKILNCGLCSGDTYVVVATATGGAADV